MAKTVAIVLVCCLAFAAVATAHKGKHDKHSKHDKHNEYSDSYSGGDSYSGYDGKKGGDSYTGSDGKTGDGYSGYDGKDGGESYAGGEKPEYPSGEPEYPSGGDGYKPEYPSGGDGYEPEYPSGKPEYPKGWNEHPGRITHIYCYLNHWGFIGGLAYKNEYTGYKTFCDRPASGYYSSDCSEESTTCKKMELGCMENIIRVEACRGGKYGYTSVKFYTDLNKTLECGSGDYSFTPPKYDSYGSDYQKGKYYKGYSKDDYSKDGYSKDDYNKDGYSKDGYSKDDYSKHEHSKHEHSKDEYSGDGYSQDEYSKHGKRQLLEEGSDDYAGADLDYYKKKGYGWGWDSKCQIFEPPSQPTWSGENKDWYSKGYNSGNYGYAQDSSYSKSWKAYDSYYSYSGKDGKKSYYYKDYDTYKKYSDGCAKSSCDHTPDYYYKQVWPLASFKAKCDRDGSVYDVYKLKWNQKYMAPKPANLLPIILSITLDDGVTCADANTAELRSNITSLLASMQETSGGVVGDVEMSPDVQCVDSSATVANTTITADVALNAAEGSDVTDLVSKLTEMGIVSGTDLCTAMDGQCEWPVQNAICTWKYQQWNRLQAMLVDNQFRQSLKRYVTIVKAVKA